MRAINLILSLAFFCVEKKGNIFLFSSVSSISSNYRHRKSTESGSFQPSPAQGFISGLEKKTKNNNSQLFCPQVTKLQKILKLKHTLKTTSELAQCTGYKRESSSLTSSPPLLIASVAQVGNRVSTDHKSAWTKLLSKQFHSSFLLWCGGRSFCLKKKRKKFAVYDPSIPVTLK